MQLVVSPIVVCPPHLKSPLSNTHGKQEAVCNPLKLEYARLSLTGTVGGGISKASLDGVSFHCAPSFYFLHYFRIIFSFDFYIFKSFLGHSDQNTFSSSLLPHLPACVSLYFHTRAESEAKKIKGGGLWTILRLHARMASIRQKQQGGRVRIPASALVYTFFSSSCCSHVLLVWMQLLYVLHWASVTKRRIWLASYFRERET